MKPPGQKKTTDKQRKQYGYVRLSWMLLVRSLAVEHCDLQAFHSALSACWLARHVEHCEQNQTSHPPHNSVVVNIHLLLLLWVSSEGGGPDPTCAKRNKEREEMVAFNR